MISASSAFACGVADTLPNEDLSINPPPNDGRTRVHARPPLALGGSEEAELLGAVADQHVLGLLVVVEHHLVRLAADAGLLVAAEGGVRRIGVIAVGPDASGLDGAAEAVAAVRVAAPDAGAQA